MRVCAADEPLLLSNRRWSGTPQYAPPRTSAGTLVVSIARVSVLKDEASFATIVVWGEIARIIAKTTAAEVNAIVRARPFRDDSCKRNASRGITALLEDDLPSLSVQYLRKHTTFAAVWRADVQDEGDCPREVNYFRIPVLAGLDPAWSVHCQRHVGVIRPGRSVRGRIGRGFGEQIPVWLVHDYDVAADLLVPGERHLPRQLGIRHLTSSRAACG